MSAKSFSIHTSHPLNPYPVTAPIKPEVKKSDATASEKKDAKSTPKLPVSRPILSNQVGTMVMHDTGEVSDYH